jgi:hypothetical protein
MPEEPLQRFEKAVEAYAALRMSPARTVAQLIHAGFPIPLIRERFPEVSAAAFEPQAIVSAQNAQKRAQPEAPIVKATAVLPPHAPATDPLAEGVSFQYVPLIQCSFPHADPGEQTHFTRRNGWLELTLSTARPDAGLPYGVPARLLTMYCA